MNARTLELSRTPFESTATKSSAGTSLRTKKHFFGTQLKPATFNFFCFGEKFKGWDFSENSKPQRYLMQSRYFACV